MRGVSYRETAAVTFAMATQISHNHADWPLLLICKVSSLALEPTVPVITVSVTIGARAADRPHTLNEYAQHAHNSHLLALCRVLQGGASGTTASEKRPDRGSP